MRVTAMNYEQVSRELRDNLAFLGELERFHAEMRGRHAQYLRDHAQYLGELKGYRKRIDRNLAEITEKLNRLIGSKNGPAPQQPS